MTVSPGSGGILPLWRARALARRARFRLADRLSPPDPGPRITAIAARLRARPGPLRIGFVVCDPSKWSAGPLFDTLSGDPAFDCGFHCTLSDTGIRLPNATARRGEFSRNRAFFGDIGPLWRDLYDPTSDRMHDARAVEADLVFLQQPWGMQDMPRRLLRAGVLSAYVHYGYAIISNDRMQFGLPDFHRFLWAYVAPSPIHRDAILSGPTPPHGVVVAGHPKLDTYLSPAPARGSVPHWPRAGDTTRKRVIFAPHHTLDGTLNMGTFAWSGAAMLDLVRAHRDVDFLLKPHPNLALAMARNGQSDSFARWQTAWNSEPNTAQFDSGNYFDLFRSSDMMITDSGSFLAEYLPTGRPILRLTRPDAAPMNEAGQALLPAFHTADSPDALRATFQRVLIAGDDDLAAIRRDKAALVLPGQGPSAGVIRDYLGNALCSAVSGNNTGASGPGR